MPSTLRAGKGAKAAVLTRLIKPKQDLASLERDHRSTVIICDRFKNQKGTEYIQFKLLGGEEEGKTILYVSKQYVKVMEEGNPQDFFLAQGSQKSRFKEPEIVWEKSEARELLRQAILCGDVPSAPDPNFPTKDIYMSIPELSLYYEKRFSSRLSSL